MLNEIRRQLDNKGSVTFLPSLAPPNSYLHSPLTSLTTYTYLLHPHPYSIKEIRRVILLYSCPKALAMLLVIRWAWAPCWAWASWA